MGPEKGARAPRPARAPSAGRPSGVRRSALPHVQDMGVEGKRTMPDEYEP